MSGAGDPMFIVLKGGPRDGQYNCQFHPPHIHLVHTQQSDDLSGTTWHLYLLDRRGEDAFFAYQGQFDSEREAYGFRDSHADSECDTIQAYIPRPEAEQLHIWVTKIVELTKEGCNVSQFEVDVDKRAPHYEVTLQTDKGEISHSSHDVRVVLPRILNSLQDVV